MPTPPVPAAHVPEAQTPTTGAVPRHATVADHLVDRLASWGVHRWFGYPGDGINGMTAAVQRRSTEPGDVGFVQVRHEETAGFAASAHVKYGGGPIGGALVTSGPGAIHLLNGLYDAKLDHQPVVAVVGQTGLTAQGGGYYQEVDLLALYKDVAGFLAQLDDPSQVRHLVDRACRTALAHRTVAVLVVPNDVQDAKAVLDPPHAHGFYATSNAPSSRPTVPPDTDLRAAVEVLRGGTKVAMLVGQGAYGAEPEVAALAERLGAGVATALLAMPVVDQREPWVTGSIGLLGTTPSYRLMQDCDRLLIVGSAMPYGEFYPPEGVPAVQVDIDGAQLGLRYPTQVNLTGDAAPTLRELTTRLGDHRPDPAWRAEIARRTASWRTGQLEVARQPAEPVNPQLLLTELDERLPTDAMVAVDCGTVTAWFARHLHVRPGMLASLSGTLLSMGGGLPYGIAAKFAHPDRPLIALLGDGAMQMNGVNELITVAKYWRQWQDPRFVLLVLNNRDLSFVSWEQRSGEGTPKFDESQDLPDVDYAGWARSLGLNGVRVDDPAQVGAAWAGALAADRPTVIDAVVDPAELMIPPQFTLDEARNMVGSILRGDSDWRGILRRSLPAAAATLLPHRS